MIRLSDVFKASICKRAREKMRYNYVELPCEKKEDGKCEIVEAALYCPAFGFETGTRKRYSIYFIEMPDDFNFLDEKNWTKETE